jgi:formimidoylglutamate deiminase
MQSGDAQLWFADALLPEGWAHGVRVVVNNGRIATLAADVEPKAEDERHGAAVPGLCNLHSHAFQRGMAGLAEVKGSGADGFWTWREVMYRFVDRLNPEDVEAIAAQAYVEMLESGFTRVGEFHYLHHDRTGAPYDRLGEMSERIAAAARQTGLGLTLLPVLYAHGGFGGAPAAPLQRRFLNTIDRYGRLLQDAREAVASLDDAVVGIAPHSLRAVTAEQLALASTLAAGAPIHVHIAEQTGEVEDCLAWSGQRPVQWLLDHALVDQRWCLVHATHVDRLELERVVRAQAVVGLCPITEANLGDGVFPAADFRALGGRFGVGSDSNVLIDAAEELRLLEYGQRLTRQSRNLMADEPAASTGGGLFRAAHAGGAQALGLGVAGIVIGAAADIVTLDLNHPALAVRGGDALVDGWVFAARAGAVETVWRFGRKQVQNGRHRQREPIAQRYRKTLQRLLAD